jgi:hypothetical protein
MSRSLESGVQTAIAAGSVVTATLLEVEFSSSTVYWNTTPTDLIWNGNTYSSAVLVGNVSDGEEGVKLQMYGSSIQLSGADTALLSLALHGGQRGRNCTIYLAFLNSDHSVIDNPVIIFKGRISNFEFNFGRTASIKMNVESVFSDWNRPRFIKMSNESQQRVYPGDLGFEYLEKLDDQSIAWGKG